MGAAVRSSCAASGTICRALRRSAPMAMGVCATLASALARIAATLGAAGVLFVVCRACAVEALDGQVAIVSALGSHENIGVCKHDVLKNAASLVGASYT